MNIEIVTTLKYVATLHCEIQTFENGTKCAEIRDNKVEPC